MMPAVRGVEPFRIREEYTQAYLSTEVDGAAMEFRSWVVLKAAMDSTVANGLWKANELFRRLVVFFVIHHSAENPTVWASVIC